MARAADNEQIIKFRADAKFLLSLYTNAGMDKNLRFNGNFSGYVNGHKRPSVEKIRKFYEVYGKDLERFDREVPLQIMGELNSPPAINPEYIDELISIRDNLVVIKEMLTSRQYQQELAELHSKLDKIEDRLPKDNPT